MTSNHSTSYKHNFAATLLLVSLCVLCGNSSAQHFKSVHRGVEYAQVTHKLGNDPVKVNLLRLDLTKVRLDVHHAFDRAIGLEPTSAIATRHRAVAAINAGFFRLDKSEFAGDAAGVLRINSRLLSESLNHRIAMGIVNGAKRTRVSFEHTKAYLFVGLPDSFTIWTDGINREAKSNETILYTPEHGRTPRTTWLQTEIRLTKCYNICGKVEFAEGHGGTLVPGESYVISVGGEKRIHFTDKLRRAIETNTFPLVTVVGMAVAPNEKANSLTHAEDIVAGVPQLIKNGKIDITWEQEKAAKSFVEMRHPRTAVAKLKDGKFLMITVDGRQPGVSVGMTLQELAEYLFSLGATDAMNLDGGGSTTMFLDGKVVNTPSDKEGERKVSDAILVTLRK